MEIWRAPLHVGQTIKNMGRLRQILTVLARHGLAKLIERSRVLAGLSPEALREIKEWADKEGDVREEYSLAKRLRMAMEELGPAFVKLGQMLAMREDLISQPYIEELKKLQCQVESFPYVQAEKILVDALGAEKLAEFEWIDPRPLASGSMGQVHEARLKGGRRVVLKIQRPGIEPLMKVDLSLMQFMAGLVEKHIPELKALSPTWIVEELARVSLAELDFLREAAHTAKMAQNLKALAYLEIPEIYWEYSNTRVLTLSYVDGHRFKSREELIALGFDPSLIIERGVHTFLTMVFEKGFYHGDLHPGNFILLDLNRIGLIDFGIVVTLSRPEREAMAGLILGIMREDFDEIGRCLVELARPEVGFDLRAFTGELASVAVPYLGLKLKHMRSAKLMWELAKVAGRHRARLPREMVLFLRNLVALEGIAHQLDPEFDLIEVCKPLVNQVMTQMYGQDYIKREALVIGRDIATLLRHSPFEVRRLLQAVSQGELHINLSHNSEHRVVAAFERGLGRVAFAILASGFAIAAALLLIKHPEELNISPRVLGAMCLGFAAFVILVGFWPRPSSDQN